MAVEVSLLPPSEATAFNSIGYSMAIGNVMSNTSDAEINFIGDSTTAGLASGVTPYVPLAVRVKTLMPATIPVAIGWVPLRLADVFANIVVGAGWTNGAPSNGGFGNNSGIGGNAPAGSIVFTPYDSCDEFDVLLFRNTGYGTVTITGTGGTPVVQSAAGTLGVIKATCLCSALSASNTLTITGSGSNCYVLAVRARNTTKKQLYFNQLGVGSSRADAWGLRDGSLVKSQACLAFTSPSVTFIQLGINDARYSVTPESYKASIENILLSSPSSTVVICPPMKSSASDAGGVTLANELLYVQQARLVASESGAKFLDLQGYFPDHSNADYYDSYHPKPHLYQRVSLAYFKALTA